MPVGKPGPDGTILPSPRAHRGSGGLGVVGVWDCPGCGKKVEGQAPEQGCPHCGAGVPSSTPAAAVAPTPSAEGEAVRAPRAATAVPRVASVEQLAEASTVYRLIAYQGPAAWLEETLRRSLVGQITVTVGGQITATIVDDVSVRQADLLRMASRQPGVWLGGSMETVRALLDEAAPTRLPDPRRHYGAMQLTRTDPVIDRAVAEWKKEQQEMPQTPSTVTPTPDQKMIAESLHSLLGHTGAYTLANALQQFSTVVEDETMERDKYWAPSMCLGVATALLDLIPAEWQGAAADAADAVLDETPPTAPAAAPAKPKR